MQERPDRRPDRYKRINDRTHHPVASPWSDASRWTSFRRVDLWDRVVLAAVGPGLARYDILDVGCATGRLLERLAAAGATRLCGVDSSPKVLGAARERFSRRRAKVDLRPGDPETAIPWPAGAFDIATLIGVLHRFRRPIDALSEIRRVLRPAGRLIVVDPCLFTPLRQSLGLALRIAPHAGNFRFYSRRMAVSLLGGARFRCEEARRVGLWAYLVVGEQPGRRVSI